jgi:hypothetical protein
MSVLPSSLALTNIADGSNIVAADHRNNYAAIQTAVNALIAITSNGNGTDGDAMVWDGVNAKWVPASTLAATRPRAPRVVTSAMSGGPPSSPLDQDIWIATAVDANGTRWHFQYNAGSASASKWEYIGGAPLFALISAKETTASNVYTALTTAGPSITLPRAGDYDIETGAEVYAPINAGPGFFAVMSYDIGGTGAADIDWIASQNEVNQAQDVSNSLMRKKRQTALAAVTLTAKYRSSSGTNSSFEKRWMAVTPVRIT